MKWSKGRTPNHLVLFLAHMLCASLGEWIQPLRVLLREWMTTTQSYSGRQPLQVLFSSLVGFMCLPKPFLYIAIQSLHDRIGLRGVFEYSASRFLKHTFVPGSRRFYVRVSGVSLLLGWVSYLRLVQGILGAQCQRAQCQRAQCFRSRG